MTVVIFVCNLIIGVFIIFMMSIGISSFMNFYIDDHTINFIVSLLMSSTSLALHKIKITK